jgi:hypothetical protein
MDWNEIRQKVETNKNVLTLKMAVLRDAAGKGKLGTKVNKGIDKQLNELGLGHVPHELPNNQNALVRLYKRGTPIGVLVERASTPSKRYDSYLGKQFSDKEADEGKPAARSGEPIGG